MAVNVAGEASESIAVPLSTPASRTQFSRVVVDASANSIKNEWHDTGLEIKKGSVLEVAAVGRACLDKVRPTVCSGPSGLSYTCNETIPRPSYLNEPKCGALVGRIGIDGTPFTVGSRLEPEIQNSGGILYLGYQDLDYASNSGKYFAYVTVIGP